MNTRSFDRSATTPTEISRSGWWQILKRVRRETKSDNVSLLAAGVAFYGLLALVPALVACVSLYGLVADPTEVSEQVVSALSASPEEVCALVATQLESIASTADGAAVLGVLLGLVVALWSASAGTGHLIDALTVAYDGQDTRGWARRKAVALAFTVGAVLFVVVAVGTIAFLPAVVAETGLGRAGRAAVGVARWALLVVGVLAGLAVLYRYAPARREPRWRWVTPGAVLATAMWVLGSAAFSVYAANFARSNETYGSLGAVVVLMLWLFLTALAVLVGGELNAEVERQAAPAV